MRQTRRWLPLLAILTGVLAAAALLAVVLAPAAQAQEEPQEPEAPAVAATPDRFITVQGNARVKATPDQATVRLGVVTQAPTATAALADNAVLMQEVVSATLDLDIDEEQVSTEVVQLYPVYSDIRPVAPTTGTVQPQTTEPQIVAYRATNVVAVIVDDVSRVGRLLDAATAAGANSVEGISFEISDRDSLLAMARRQAIRDARTRAETYLEEADGVLGQVRVIREQGTSAQPLAVAQEFAVARDATTPILPGQETVEVTVEVTWAIELPGG